MDKTIRQNILESAITCVCGRRQEDYGTPEDNFKTIAKLWTVYLEASHKEHTVEISAKDVAMMMALLKVARISSGSNLDSFIDLAGYAACAAEIVSNKSS